jgi:hypothetical protein
LRRHPAPSPPMPRSGTIAGGAGSRMGPIGPYLGTATVTLQSPWKSTPFWMKIKRQTPQRLRQKCARAFRFKAKGLPNHSAGARLMKAVQRPVTPRVLTHREISPGDPCRFRILRPFDSRSAANQSIRGGGWKPKFWYCGGGCQKDQRRTPINRFAFVVAPR